MIDFPSKMGQCECPRAAEIWHTTLRSIPLRWLKEPAVLSPTCGLNTNSTVNKLNTKWVHLHHLHLVVFFYFTFDTTWFCILLHMLQYLAKALQNLSSAVNKRNWLSVLKTTLQIATDGVPFFRKTNNNLSLLSLSVPSYCKLSVLTLTQNPDQCIYREDDHQWILRSFLSSLLCYHLLSLDLFSLPIKTASGLLTARSSYCFCLLPCRILF